MFKFAEEQYVGTVLSAYICKSCGDVLNISTFTEDGAFDEQGNFITFYSKLMTELIEIPKYKELINTIDFIDRQLENIGNIFNILNYVSYNRKSERDAKTKDIIDLIKFNNVKNKYYQFIVDHETKTIQNSYTKRILQNPKQKKQLLDKQKSIIDNIKKKYIKKTKFSILKSVNLNQIDEYNNVIISFLILLVIIELNNSEIINLTQTNRVNFFTFKKYKDNLFKDLYIYKSLGSSDKIPILKNYIFCYILFIFSAFILEHRIWKDVKDKGYTKLNRIRQDEQKIIIHTCIDILNSFIEIRNNDINNIYQHINEEADHIIYITNLFNIISVKFFDKVTNIYRNNKIRKEISNRIYNILYPNRNTLNISHKEPEKFTVSEYLQLEYNPRIKYTYFNNLYFYIKHEDIRLSLIHI